MLFSNIKDLNEKERRKLLQRTGSLEEAIVSVKQIISDVKLKGDEAILSYTEKFDKVKLEDFRVSEEEFAEAREKVEEEVVEALREAHVNILGFHKRQLVEEWSYDRDGIRLEEIQRPLRNVGCYIPGGRAAYPSTALMTITPAKVAGVERIVCVTPPNKDGRANELVLVACEIAGAKEVYKVGGAHAIAALVYGTESIPKVEKIVGPGNIYVTAAKEVLSRSREVAVDMPAGPSEILIIADEGANPEYIALDMLAQAEHDPNAASILVTTSPEIGKLVVVELEKHVKDKTKESLEKNGAVLIAQSLEEATDFANEYAPEHLQIMVKEPREVLAGIRNAGSVFLGEYTPVALGDYATGTNHVLPTMGYARVFSGLSVRDFMKHIPVQEASEEGIKRVSKIVIKLAEAEGLQAHADSVKKRIK
ncbi:MAG: histidinol dehydrogenase [Candidatus Hydrothermarchaeales archaeon]